MTADSFRIKMYQIFQICAKLYKYKSTCTNSELLVFKKSELKTPLPSTTKNSATMFQERRSFKNVHKIILPL